MTLKDQDFSREPPLRGLFAAAAIVMMSLVSLAHAQAAADSSTAAPKTRAQVKMELAEFRRTHTWHEQNGTWTLKPGIEPPEGAKTARAVEGRTQ